MRRSMLLVATLAASAAWLVKPQSGRNLRAVVPVHHRKQVVRPKRRPTRAPVTMRDEWQRTDGSRPISTAMMGAFG